MKQHEKLKSTEYVSILGSYRLSFLTAGQLKIQKSEPDPIKVGKIIAQNL